MTNQKPSVEFAETDLSYKKLSSVLSVKNIDALRHMNKVLSTLSKLDALEIFALANNSFISELDTPQKIGLTKKQYYTRLKQLCELNLIAKNGNSYVHTSFGSIIYDKHVIGLLNNMKNIKELEMMDLLKKSSKFDSQDISDFLTKIGLRDNSTTSDSALKIISSYEDMVTKAIETIEFAQKEIILMTRYPNELIINALLKKASMGVSVKVMADTNMIDQYISQESSKMISDKNNKERNEVVVNPFYPAKIERKYGKVPFSLLMIDQSHIGIEIINKNNPEKFNLAIYADSHNMGMQMKHIFNNFWQSTSIAPQLIKKTN